MDDNGSKKYQEHADWIYHDLLDNYPPTKEALDSGRITEDQLRLYASYLAMQDFVQYGIAKKNGIPIEQVDEVSVDNLAVVLLAKRRNENHYDLSIRLENICRGVEGIEPKQNPYLN